MTQTNDDANDVYNPCYTCIQLNNTRKQRTGFVCPAQWIFEETTAVLPTSPIWNMKFILKLWLVLTQFDLSLAQAMNGTTRTVSILHYCVSICEQSFLCLACQHRRKKNMKMQFVHSFRWCFCVFFFLSFSPSVHFMGCSVIWSGHLILERVLGR